MNYNERLRKLRQRMEEEAIDCCFLWHPDNQHYFTGFRVISYSRPIFTLVTEAMNH